MRDRRAQHGKWAAAPFGHSQWAAVGAPQRPGQSPRLRVAEKPQADGQTEGADTRPEPAGAAPFNAAWLGCTGHMAQWWASRRRDALPRPAFQDRTSAASASAALLLLLSSLSLLLLLPKSDSRRSPPQGCCSSGSRGGAMAEGPVSTAATDCRVPALLLLRRPAACSTVRASIREAPRVLIVR